MTNLYITTSSVERTPGANDIIRIIVIFYYTFLLYRLAKGTGTLMEKNLAILVNKCDVFLLHE